MKRIISGVLVLLLSLAAFSAFAVDEIEEGDMEYSLRPAKSYAELLALVNKFQSEQTRYYATGAIEILEEAADEAAVEAPTAAEPAKAESAATNTAAAEGSASYSETNVQEQGVDESDIIKTDGKYIYTLRQSGNGYKLSFVKADGKGGMSEVGHKLFRSTDGRLSGAEMFLKDNRLAVIFSEYSEAISGQYVTVMVYDVSVPEKAVLIKADR